MKIKNRTLTLILVAISLGCQDHSSDKSNYGKSEYVPIKELTADFEFQKVLLNNGIDLFHSEVITHEEQIIISSRSGKVISLNMYGKVNWFIERPGRGPGEFHDPHDMRVSDNMIGILDKENAKVRIFTTDGSFYKDVQLRGLVDQFGMVDGGIHIFYPYDNDFLFARYDIETGKEHKYGDRNLLKMLPDLLSSDNYLFFKNLLLTDSKYTIVALVHYGQMLIYDRETSTGTFMDLSTEMEIERSLETYRENSKNYPPGSHVRFHFLDLVNLGKYFGVMIPGPVNQDFADMYRFKTNGKIHDKVYMSMDGEFMVGGMKNLSLLNDGTYFGHISSQDKLVIVDIVDQENSSE